MWYIHCSLENRCYWLTSAEWREHLQISRRPVSFYPGASYQGPRWCRLRQEGSSWQCQGEALDQQSNFADLFVVFKALEARGQCMKEWIWSIVLGCASTCLRAKAGTFPIHFSKSMYGWVTLSAYTMSGISSPRDMVISIVGCTPVQALYSTSEVGQWLKCHYPWRVCYELENRRENYWHEQERVWRR